MDVEFLTLPNGKCPSEEFFESLDNKSLAKIYSLIERLESEGRLVFPHAKKLEGYKGLWELRVKAKQKAVRVFYVYWKLNKIILVSGFVKKSQKTPRRELDKAIKYLKLAGVTL